MGKGGKMKRVLSIDNINAGDYVLCTKYSDRDPRDQWQVGFLDSVEQVGETLLFKMKDPQRSYFKCCWLITSTEGKEIVKLKNPKLSKKFLSILLFILMLSGCYSHENPPEYKAIECIEGHRYVIYKTSVPYRGYMGMAPLFNKEGKPIQCEK